MGHPACVADCRCRGSMGAIEDVRNVVQDLVAPDLKAIRAELKEIQGRLDRIEGRLDEVLVQSRRQHEETIYAVRSVIDFAEVKQRLSALEKRLPESSH